MRVAGASTETELQPLRGEDEVPAELPEVHRDLVHTAGLGRVCDVTDVPRSADVSLVPVEGKLAMQYRQVVLLQSFKFDH